MLNFKYLNFGCNIVESLADIIKKLWTANERVITSKEFNDIFFGLNKQFMPGTEQDAHELFRVVERAQNEVPLCSGTDESIRGALFNGKPFITNQEGSFTLWRINTDNFMVVKMDHAFTEQQFATYALEHYAFGSYLSPDHESLQALYPLLTKVLEESSCVQSNPCLLTFN